MSVSAEGERVPAAMLCEIQPAGAVFALGWVMAQLFDPRRRVSVTAGTPPFNPQKQLPLVADLAADPKLVFLAAELTELLRWFPVLRRPLRLVTAETRKKRAAIEEENLATAEAAAHVDDILNADDTLHSGAIPFADDIPDGEAAGSVATTAFSEVAFLDAVTGLHQAILYAFTDDPERLSAYQLGLILSDLVWLPSIGPAGQESPDSRPSALFGLFARPHLATVQTLLSGAGTQLPPGASTVVSRSLDNWADWIDLNSGRIKSPVADAWSDNADVVLNALRVQGWVWRAVLVADQEVSVTPSMGAWVQAGASIARATRMISEAILRRFWPLLVFALVLLGGLLYLVISSLSGLSEVWASLATVTAVVGSTTYGLGNGVSSAISGVGDDIWNAAKLDAAAWGVTWLPALTTTAVDRVKMERRGVAAPQLRKSMDVS